MYIIGHIVSEEVCCLVDTGSSLCVLHPSVYRNIDSSSRPELFNHDGQIRMADGGLVSVLGRVRIDLVIGNFSYDAEFLVANVEAPVVLGMNFLTEHNAILDAAAKTLSLNGQSFLCKSEGEMPSVFKVTLPEAIIVPPNSEVIVTGLLEGKPQFTTGFFEISPALRENKPLLLAKMVAHTTGVEVPLRFINPSDEPQHLYRGQVAACCEEALVDESSPIEDYVDADGRQVPPHIAPLLESCQERLAPEQMIIVRDLLCKYENAFAKSDEDLGETDLEMHRIDTGDAKPIKIPPRRMPFARKAAVREEVHKLKKMNVIEDSMSPWAAPIVLVKKKDGIRYRFCLDYRELNKVTKKDSYPLPRIDDSLDQLQGSVIFSCLDLNSGYFQCLVHPDDREKTAFVTQDGLFQFRTLPQGVVNGVANFSRLMDKVFAGLSQEILLVYIDDIITLGRSFEDHVRNLELVLIRITQANLKISPSKCQLFQSEVKFLGFKVSKFGLSPDPDKISAVVDWPRPTTQTQTRAYLGLCSYYRRFVKGFATIASPLHKLTEKSDSFNWNIDCQKAFDSLKSALTSAPILGFPIDQEDGPEFIIDCDASGYALGAVLSQVQNNEETVLAYYSKSFSKPERNYCVTRRELKSLVASVKHFHHYVYGRKVLIRTDHGALRWLMNFKNPEGQIARWLEVLSTYELTIVHRAGTKHTNADGLSRRPCGECKYCERQELKEKIAEVHPNCNPLCAGVRDQQSSPKSSSDWLPVWSLEELETLQKDDLIVNTALSWVKQGERPSWSDMRNEGAVLRRFWTMWKQLTLKDGLLYVLAKESTTNSPVLRLVAPHQVRTAILEFLHDHRTAAHLGITKTHKKVRDRFWWPQLKKDVVRWCKFCPACQKRNLRVGRRTAPLQQEPVGSPLERMAMDILSFRETTADGNCCVLVIIDYFSKYADAFALPDHTALTVADCLVTEVFTRVGVPLILHSDQGAEFTSNLMNDLCRLLQINKTRTTPYHARSDGLTEKFNSTLINMLSKFCNDNKENWDDHLPYIMCAYRASVQESTGFTPNRLFLGREINLPVDVMFPVGDRHLNVSKGCPVKYVEWVQQTMEQSFEHARENLRTSAIRQKSYYDKRAIMRKFQRGDWVVRYYHPLLVKSKLNNRYMGPYVVLRPVNEVTYEIQLNPESKPLVVHVDDLKPFYAKEDRENWVLKVPVETDIDNLPTPGAVGGTDSVDNLPTPGAVGGTDSVDEAPGAMTPCASFQPMQNIPTLSPERILEDCLPIKVQTPRRGHRERKTPARFKDFVL